MKVPLETLNRAGSAIALILVGLLVYLVWALINHEVPQSNENILYAVVGVVATQITQIVSFFFGSSQSTKKQAETIDKLAETLPKQPAPTVELKPGESATVEATP